MIRFRSPLLLAALALPAIANPPGFHPFPWVTGEQLLQQLDRPANQADAAAAVAYLKGVMDASADRQWCYSLTRPGTGLVQPALTDKLRSLAPAQATQSAAVLAVQAWQEKWPCPPKGCCHA
jgi:hypothetical protein